MIWVAKAILRITAKLTIAFLALTLMGWSWLEKRK